MSDLILNDEVANSINAMLPAGDKWLQREYYCKNFSVSDYERCGDYMKKQNVKDDYIILKIEYNPMKSTCKFIDKVRLGRSL